VGAQIPQVSIEDPVAVVHAPHDRR
jgi:hypothetical protein